MVELVVKKETIGKLYEIMKYRVFKNQSKHVSRKAEN